MCESTDRQLRRATISSQVMGMFLCLCVSQQESVFNVYRNVSNKSMFDMSAAVEVPSCISFPILIFWDKERRVCGVSEGRLVLAINKTDANQTDVPGWLDNDFMSFY